MSKDLTDAWARMSEAAQGTTRVDTKLPSAKTAPAIPARSGSAVAKSTTTSGSGGGVASPLTEIAYANRTFWASRSVTSPDGIFTIAFRPLKSLKMQDANAAEVVFNFVDPPTA